MNRPPRLTLSCRSVQFLYSPYVQTSLTFLLVPWLDHSWLDHSRIYHLSLNLTGLTFRLSFGYIHIKYYFRIVHRGRLSPSPGYLSLTVTDIPEYGAL